MQQHMMDIINQLKSNQEKIEKTSFDTINQHDRVMNLVGQLVMDLDCMMTKLEAMNYTLEETIETLCCDTDVKTTQTMQCFSTMLEEQSSMIIEVSQLLQVIMDEQLVESDVIHEMEAQIASNRETMEEIIDIHNN